MNQAAIPKAQWHPLPLVEVPFDCTGIDLNGPFHRSAWGYHFVLVLMDYATQYLKAVLLRSFSAKSMVGVGDLKEIMLDKATLFMLKELLELLGFKCIRTSMQHPQINGLVEHLNKKSMIREFIHNECNWECWGTSCTVVWSAEGAPGLHRIF